MSFGIYLHILRNLCAMYRMFRNYLLVISILLCSLQGITQKINYSRQLQIKETNAPVKIDGSEDDAAWEAAAAATGFQMVLPMDTSKARVLTAVKMSYDRENLYLLAVNFHAPGQPFMVESMKRDFIFGKNDNFLLFMDPFDDKTNGFSFGANAAGAQWDGVMYEGGKVDLSWDNKWRSEVKYYEDRWVFEAAIPFKSIRYKKGITEWGINFSRLDIIKAEKSSWAPVPRQFPTASLAYTGTLVWDKAPPDPGTNISIIPYVLGGVSRNFEAKTPADFKTAIGGDAKIAVSSALNLDLTVNPDFSQVEVDRQVTNLDRFELFFPERRQFFLENGDLFANFGYNNIRPFFSRRIGLNVPINYGARLSGKLNKDWRIGLMNMQTASQQSRELPAQNFTVLALQRRVFSRSNIGILMVNKQSLNYNPPDTAKFRYSPYNRNIGLEYNLASRNNQWTGKVLFLKSFSPGSPAASWSQAANLLYSTRHWSLSWQHEYVGKQFIAETGYVPRNNYIKLNPAIGYLFLRKEGNLLSHGPKLSSTHYYNTKMRQTDNETFLAYGFNFRSQSTGTLWVAHNYVELLAPFDPTNFKGDTLARGTKHNWNAFGTEYISKPQRRFTFGFSTRYGGYYANGRRLNITTDLGFRFQPYVNIALNTSYNYIDLPQPWGKTIFWLIGPRVDLTLTNTLFFTTFLQYNDQLKNINLNTRLQWRYKPASDLFVVYTDNYYTAPLFVRNRALVVKFTYWWNG